MLFSILQRNNFISFVLLPIVIIGLWFPYLLKPTMTIYYYDQNPMPLYKPLLYVYNSNNYLGFTIFFIAIILCLILLSYINSTFRMLEKRSSLYLLLFIIFSSFTPQFQQFNPMPFACIFVLLGIYSIYKLYKNEFELRAVFEAGFCFAIASLLYVQTIFVSIFIFVGIIQLVPFYWRQWIAGLFGLVTPYIFVVSWAFINNSLPKLLETIDANMIVWHSWGEISLPLYISIISIISIFIISLLFSFSGALKKVALQKYYLLQFFLLLFVIIIFAIIPGAGIEIFYFSVIPLSFYITNYLLNIRNTLIPEIITFILIGLRIFLFIA